MHRCYVPDAAPGEIAVDADQAHHIATVLRLAAGDAVSVFDGRGREWDARIVAVARARVVLAIGLARQVVTEPPVAVTLAVGLLKGDRMREVVRDATALGVVRIVPLLTQHTAAARAAAGPEPLRRWQRIAVAAAAQSGRAVVPEIGPPQTVTDLVEDASEPLLVCVEPATEVVRDGVGPRPERVILMVGPEGGWTPREVAAATSRGARTVELGPRTLRAELAPVVALATLWSRWGW